MMSREDDERLAVRDAWEELPDVDEDDWVAEWFHERGEREAGWMK